MSGKNQFPSTLNWQSANPQTGFLPTHQQGGSIPSGTVAGTMATTATIYSNIIDMSKMDNIGAEVNWTGTPTGTITVYGSNSGANWYSLFGSGVLTQPAGSASGYLINFNQYSYKYIMFKYVNASGSGSLTVYLQSKDLN